MQRMQLIVPIALVIGLLPAFAAADEVGIPEVKVCELLTNQELTTWYPDQAEPKASTQLIDVGAGGAPAAFRVSSCMRAGGEATLMVERYADAAAMTEVSAWLAKVDADDEGRKGFEDLHVVKIDGAVCETGHYAIPASGGMQGDHTTYHYVACDQIDGHHHLVLNLQWPDDQTHLPSPQQTKSLLDLARGRIAAATQKTEK